MVFLSVCVALYQYVPRDEGELAIEEGELVYILEKSTEDDWWKATKKASGGEKDDPIGLIPQTYVEEVTKSTQSSQCSAKMHFHRLNLHIMPRRSTTTHDRRTRSYHFQRMQRLQFMTLLIPTGPWLASMASMGLCLQTTLNLLARLALQARHRSTHRKRWLLVNQ